MTPNIDSLARAAAEEITPSFAGRGFDPEREERLRQGLVIKNTAIIARACTAAVKEAALATAWRPIATAPKDRMVLVYDLEAFNQVAWYEERVNCWINPYRLERVTHWQPLPLPPAPTKEGA